MITFAKLQQVKETITDCLLNFISLKNYYNMIAIDLSKQQALDADPKAIQQINFTGKLDRAAGAKIFFIVEKVK